MFKGVRLFSALLCCISIPVLAQQKDSNPATKYDYSQQAIVVEQSSSKLKYENDGSYTGTDYARVDVQSDAGVQAFGVLTFPYESSVCTVDLDFARVRKPDGSTILTPAENVQDMSTEITRQAPLYSDLREKHVAVKGLTAGNVLEYQARWTCDKPLVPGQFWYAFNVPKDRVILEQNLEISVPAERKIKLKSSEIKPDISEDRKYRTYRWKSSNLEVKNDVQQKEEQAKTAQEQARGRLPQPDIMLSSFQSWEEVGRWYSKLQADRVDPSPEIRAKAAELTKDAPDEVAKINAIYNYVSTEFHYVGVDFGIGRYQPHKAAEIFENRYGDCKDKHTLLASMLQAIGVQAFPALINSKQDIDPDVPSPGQFDHVITVVAQGKNLLWLDTTPEVAPFEFLVSPLRDKHALVIPDVAEPMLAVTPADPPYPASKIFRMEGKLNDSGTLEGKATFTVRNGDAEVLFRSAFRRVPVAQWNQLLQQISYAIGFAGDVTEGTATSPEKLDEPFMVSYHYTRKDYPDWANRQISPPLPPIVFPNAGEDEHAPSYPIWLGAPESSDFESRIEVPKNYVPKIPAPVDSKDEFAEYHASSSFEGGVLITHRHVTTKIREIPVQKYEAYKKFTKSISDDHDAYIALSRNKSSAPLAHASDDEESPMMAFQKIVMTLPGTTDPDAFKFAMEAQQAIGQMDANRAIASLKSAVAADPKFARGWIMLGSFQLMSNQISAALESFHRAIAADPSVPGIYKAVALELMSKQKFEEAVPIWQDLVKLAPDDRDAYAYLGSALMDEGRYTDAITAFESAEKLKPGRVLSLTGLGSAYLHAGEDDKAIATFKKALDVKPEAEMYNNAAFELAEANKQLPVSLEWAKKAVQMEEEASSKLELSNLQPDDLFHINALAANWDTLGWVYFRMGEVDTAEKYLVAAWQLSGMKVIGDHLRELYGARHKKFSGDADDINRMRTVSLPRLAESNSSAEFFVLLDKDLTSARPKVEDVKFISGSDTLRSAAKTLRSAKFELSFPDDGPTRLVRRGILGCYKYTGCSFVMLTPDSVHSVN